MISIKVYFVNITRKPFVKSASLCGCENFAIAVCIHKNSIIFRCVSIKRKMTDRSDFIVCRHHFISYKSAKITENLIWNYADSKLSYTDGNTVYYLYAQPASGWWSWWLAPTLTVSDSDSTDVSFSNNKLKISNYYLRYSNGSISLNRSATTTYFFIEE